MASVSRGDRSRPSNSMPPSTIVVPTEMCRCRSRGHPNIGLTLWVAGPPILITATRRRFWRSSTALVACVVPSMTWVIRLESTPGALQHGVDRRGDPAGDVGRARHLGLGDDPVGGVQDHRVGVGAADVDAEAAAQALAWASSSTGK